MRRPFALLAAIALVASCGGIGEPEAPTTQPPSPSTSSTAPSTTTPASTTTTTTEEVDFTVAQYGLIPEVSFGPSTALGSGCAPGTDTLPDGIWFGWVERAGPTTLDFDLACLWPGRLEPASSNDAARLRQLPIGKGALIYLDSGEPIPYSAWSGDLAGAANAPGLPKTLPFWVFVNDGMTTEIARFPDPVVWALSATAWPDLYPGCCDAGTVAPPSPDDPWPSNGWPADGFYDAWLDDYASWMETDPDYGFDLVIAKWLSCDDHADLCPEWWIGDEVTVDPDQPTLQRRLAFDEALTVVIMPILAESPIVGNGVAFKSMLSDMQVSDTEWIEVPPSEEYWNEFRELTEDPAFPFGYMPWPDSGNEFEGPVGYRGPGGTYLTWDHGWLALEMRDGQPVLHIHAGLIAG